MAIKTSQFILLQQKLYFWQSFFFFFKFLVEQYILQQSFLSLAWETLDRYFALWEYYMTSVSLDVSQSYTDQTLYAEEAES